MLHSYYCEHFDLNELKSLSLSFQKTIAGDIIMEGEGRWRPFSHVQYEAPGRLLMSSGPILAHNRNKNSPLWATLLNSECLEWRTEQQIPFIQTNTFHFPAPRTLAVEKRSSRLAPKYSQVTTFRAFNGIQTSAVLTYGSSGKRLKSSKKSSKSSESLPKAELKQMHLNVFELCCTPLLPPPNASAY